VLYRILTNIFTEEGRYFVSTSTIIFDSFLFRKNYFENGSGRKISNMKKEFKDHLA
jgi:hypothetical protein